MISTVCLMEVPVVSGLSDTSYGYQFKGGLFLIHNKGVSKMYQDVNISIPRELDYSVREAVPVIF